MKTVNPNDREPIEVQVPPKDAQLPLSDYEITFHGYHNYENQPRTEVVVKTDAVTLDEILPTIEDFLKGMGFSFRGRLDIVEEED